VRAALDTVRYWGPLVAGFLCIVISVFVGPIADWLLLIAGFGLLLDGCTAMWEKAGSTGNLTTYRQ
jgi:hypothetical protein